MSVKKIIKNYINFKKKKKKRNLPNFCNLTEM